MSNTEGSKKAEEERLAAEAAAAAEKAKEEHAAAEAAKKAEEEALAAKKAEEERLAVEAVDPMPEHSMCAGAACEDPTDTETCCVPAAAECPTMICPKGYLMKYPAPAPKRRKGKGQVKVMCTKRKLSEHASSIGSDEQNLDIPKRLKSSEQCLVPGVSWQSKHSRWVVRWYEEKETKRKYFSVHHFMKTSSLPHKGIEHRPSMSLRDRPCGPVACEDDGSVHFWPYVWINIVTR